MKHLYLLLFFLSFNTIGISQNILEFFERVPDSSLLHLTKQERKDIVKYSKDNTSEDDAISDLMDNKIEYAFSAVDLKNGYIKLVGSFPGHIQMCYWNMQNGNKLIAIYLEECGPVCFNGQLDFYEFNGIEFKPIEARNIIPEVYNDFFGENSKSKIEAFNNEEIVATLLFELPRKGKNIVAKWGNEEREEIYKRYVIGNRMDLIWNDGKFEKGKIYWEK
ncbi:DUF3256 family protein [Aequorivita sp. KMM 9714]|uniref:DUF3256 family protein n=1 Tax=Aequorivita sp. KMM 9714 TaxID=2707173 RepID=UPI0013EA1448|nr:DUF3256 family protein [Aequorivita sp. KMM 9714]NGX85058.1 DUF3256 family protein [Aequorivita sp. KMM 9714]